MQQPTEQELRTALRIAKVFSRTQQCGMAMLGLRRLRNKKTIWIGEEELALRDEIDTYTKVGGGF